MTNHPIGGDVTEEQDVLTMAAVGMPGSYWATGVRIKQSFKTLGLTLMQASDLPENDVGDGRLD